MKRHHRRHSRYLLIALAMVALIFVSRGSMSDWMQERRSGDANLLIDDTSIDQSDTTSTFIITKSDPALPLPTTTATAITSGVSVSDMTIVIGKQEPVADTDTTENLVETAVEPIVSRPTAIAQSVTVSGAVADIGETMTGANTTDVIITGATVMTGVAPTPIVSVPVWQPVRTSRQGKQFAYELADALDIGTGAVRTSIDGYYDTQTLYDAWSQTQDIQLYRVLVDRLETEYRYDDMLALLSEHTNLWTTDTPGRYLHALRHSSQVDVTRPDTIQTVQDALYRMEQTGVLTPADVTWQNILINTRRDGTSALLADTTIIPDLAFRNSLWQVLEYYQSQENVPEYYRDTLIAMALVQHGYFALAEKIALSVAAQDPQYILPLQILAYSRFTQRDRSQARVYLAQLSERDPDQTELYTFLRGVMSYREGTYADAALLLRQTQSPRYLPDAVRYLALAYDQLDDESERDLAFTALLQYALEPSDYYTYFYLTFFQAFQDGSLEQTGIDFDIDTAKAYVRRCTESLQGDASVVCRYGAAGVFIAYGQRDRAHETLLELYEEYPYSYLARALGDYYRSQDDTQTAMRYYFLALRSTDSVTEQNITKQKIRQLTESSDDQT